MAFSGSLILRDLDDFITPAQACTVPVKQKNRSEGQEQGVSANTEIRIDAANNYYEVAGPSSGGIENGVVGSANTVPQPLQKAEISLNDCIACSGCVTSAEEILITLQSHLEVQKWIDSNPPSSSPDHRKGILSISPQSLASLVASFPQLDGSYISTRRMLRRIRSFLMANINGGWSGVWDTTFARHLSLIEHVKEYRERHARMAAKGKGKEGDEVLLPMLASACPGWVCFAEKTHGDLLGLISETRSPQAVMGGLVKDWWGKREGLRSSQIYHVTVMPCYEKKLEASRSDFQDQDLVRDVDCVITTAELSLLLRERGFEPLIAVDGEDDKANDVECPLPELLDHPGTSSGSFLHTLIEAIQSDDGDGSHTLLHTRRIRGDDQVEYYIEDTRTREIIFKGAKFYGYSKLQTLVQAVSKQTGLGKAGKGRSAGASKVSAAMIARRKQKTIGDSATTSEEDALMAKFKAKSLDFVEVMSCPGGCINGGGQMKPSAQQVGGDELVATETMPSGSAPWGNRAWAAKVEEIYWNGLPTPPPSPGPEVKCPSWVDVKGVQADAVALRILEEVCQPLSGLKGLGDIMDDDAEERRRRFMRTAYHRVEQSDHKLLDF